MASRVNDKLLVKATRSGDLDRVIELLDRGCDVNKLGKHETTPLMLASWHGHLAIVETFLARGADPNRTAPDGASALFWACRNDHEAVARCLLAAGADVNARRASSGKDATGPSVLDVAISLASASLVDALVAAGASLDIRYLGLLPHERAERDGRHDLLPVLKRRPRRSV